MEPIGVFLCEFDNLVGRTLALHEPCDCISADEFDSISDYLIPKPQLSGRTIALRTGSRTVLCWPTCLEGAQYARNALIFSLGLVLAPCDDGATGANLEAEDAIAAERYGRVLGKAAGELASLERESGLLSDPERRDELAHLLPLLLYGLREHSSRVIAPDAAHAIHLRLPPTPADPVSAGAVEAHAVPVLLARPEPATVRDWDLTLQRLLPLIDGTRTVGAIAHAARADLPVACHALGALRSSGWVEMVDVFAFANTYAPTPNLHSLPHNRELRDAAVAAAADPTGRKPSPTFADVFRFFAAFAPTADGGGWRAVHDVCAALPRVASALDVRALVHFALLNKLLRRVHVVPLAASAAPVGVTPASTSPRERTASADGAAHAPADGAALALAPGGRYARLLDGSHTMATICSDLGVPPAVAEQRLLAEWPDCVWVSR